MDAIVFSLFYRFRQEKMIQVRYVWTRLVLRTEEKFRFHMYLDTFGRGLGLSIVKLRLISNS